MTNKTTEPRIVYSTNGHTWSDTYTSHMMMSRHDGKIHHYGKCSPDGEHWAACRVDGKHCENRFSSISKVSVGHGSETVAVQPEVTDFAYYHFRWCSRFGLRWDRCDDGNCKHTFTYFGSVRHFDSTIEKTGDTVRVSSDAKLPFRLIRFDAQRRSFESHGTELRNVSNDLARPSAVQWPASPVEPTVPEASTGAHYECSVDGKDWIRCLAPLACGAEYFRKREIATGFQLVARRRFEDGPDHHIKHCLKHGTRPSDVWVECHRPIGLCIHDMTYIGRFPDDAKVTKLSDSQVRVEFNYATDPFRMIGSTPSPTPNRPLKQIEEEEREHRKLVAERTKAINMSKTNGIIPLTIPTSDQYSSDGINWSDTNTKRAITTRPRNNPNAVTHYGACSDDGEHWHPCQGRNLGTNCGSLYASSEFFDQGLPGVGGGETVIRLSRPEGKRCSADGFEWTKCDVAHCHHRYTYFGKFWGNVGIASGSAIGDDIHTVRITDDSILPFRQIRTHQDRLKRKAQNEKAQHNRETVSHLECSVDNVGWGRCATPETCTSPYVRRVMMDGSIQPNTPPVTAAPSATPAPPIDTRYVKCRCGKHYVHRDGDLYAQHHAWARTHEEENRWVCAGTFYAPGHGISHPKTGFKPLTILPDDQTGDEFEKWGR